MARLQHLDYLADRGQSQHIHLSLIMCLCMSHTKMIFHLAVMIHNGGRMATADARLTGPDGKLYAHASTTCFIYDTP